MVTENHYRWDFIGLSTDNKPTPATSEKVVDGSTFYCSDTSKLYVYCKDNWYERKPLGGGGGGGGIVELTAEDYNYDDGNTGTNNTIGLWLLDDGLYALPQDSQVAVKGALSGSYLSAFNNMFTDHVCHYLLKQGNQCWFFKDTSSSSTNLKNYSSCFYCTLNKSNGSFNFSGANQFFVFDNVSQSTGQSANYVMSQDATTKLIYPDIANSPYKQVIGEGSIGGTNKGLAINGNLSNSITQNSIAIGAPDGNRAQIGVNGRADVSIAIGANSACSRGWHSVAIGSQASTDSGQNTGDNVAIGYNSLAGNAAETSTVALGAYAKTTRTGEVNIGAGTSGTGYNSTNYRVLGGVHDGQLAQDAVTVNQVNSVIDAINAALSTNISHIGA